MRTSRVAILFIPGLVNNAVSAVVIALPWVHADRRLGDSWVGFLICYSLLSLVIGGVGPSRSRGTFDASVYFAGVIPLVAAAVSYAVVSIPWIERSATAMNLVSVLVTALYYPYLALWGPLISLANVAIAYVLCRATEVRKQQGSV